MGCICLFQCLHTAPNCGADDSAGSQIVSVSPGGGDQCSGYGERKSSKLKGELQHPLLCCSNPSKIMFGLHVLLITYTAVLCYLMPASDGWSIILYKREHICFLRVTAHNLLLYNAEYFAGWCLSALSIQPGLPDNNPH